MTWALVKETPRRVWRVVRSSPRDQLLLLQTFVMLGHSRYLIKKKGLSAIEPLLGSRMNESPYEIPPTHQARVEKVARAVQGTRLYTPWESNCFPQALTAQRLLAKDGIECTVYFGAVRRAPQAAAEAGVAEVGDFAAHAWTRAGETFVTGGDVRELYTPMVWFAP